MLQIIQSLGRSKVKVLEARGRAERLQGKEVMAEVDSQNSNPVRLVVKSPAMGQTKQSPEATQRRRVQAQKSDEQLVLCKIFYSQNLEALCAPSCVWQTSKA